ncbi:hypothetical protein ACLB2K_027821 [Fragaria x ananassa]
MRPGMQEELSGCPIWNGTGKSTALGILAAHLKPNLGRFDNSPEWQEILTYFQGSELQNYFTRVLEEDLKAILKLQYVENIPREIQGTVGEVLNREDQRGLKEELCVDLELNQVLDRNVGDLSGGELQRFAIAVAVMKNAKIWKSTYIKSLAGLVKLDSESTMEIPEFNVSYKRQKISPKFTGTVRDWLHTEIRDSYTHPQFVSDVMKALLLKEIIDQQVQNLSGGERQRVAICQ